MVLPSFWAFPRHTPSSSFFRLETLVYPLDSIRDLACRSVKLFAPATGLLELFWSRELMALFPGSFCAGGFWANTGAVKSVRKVIPMIVLRIEGLLIIQ